MRFGIVIYHERKRIRLVVEQVAPAGSHESFNVIAKNKTLTITSNRRVPQATA
ncbi:MAG: hypothetical protein U0U70_17585 [Chitinophagaceae bacterium]